jgi:hypothetical protein
MTTNGLAAAPRDVLDAHVSLFRHAQVRAPALRASLRSRMVLTRGLGDALFFAHAESVDEDGHQHHHHPADFAGEMCGDLARALFDARTYQVTAEMCGLAGQLTQRGLDAEAGFSVDERELPHPWGFLWLDDPAILPVSSDTDVCVRVITWMTHRDSWRLEGADVVPDGPSFSVYMFGDDPADPACPLAPVWAGEGAFGREFGCEGYGEPPARFTVNLWRLLDMEITSVARQPCGDRQLEKQARRSIRHDEISVVSLRRPKHAPSSGEHRQVEWSCAWVVRGHLRRYAQPIRTGPNAGKTAVWIKPYIKGPDGAPLKGGDVLYLLQH